MAPRIRTNLKHDLEGIDEERAAIWRECQAIFEVIAEAQRWAEENHDTPTMLRLSELNRRAAEISQRTNHIERYVNAGLQGDFWSKEEESNGI